MSSSRSAIRILLDTTSAIHGRLAEIFVGDPRRRGEHPSNEIATAEPNGGSRAILARLFLRYQRVGYQR
jgi:hypothetical protein